MAIQAIDAFEIHPVALSSEQDMKPAMHEAPPTRSRCRRTGQSERRATYRQVERPTPTRAQARRSLSPNFVWITPARGLCPDELLQILIVEREVRDQSLANGYSRARAGEDGASFTSRPPYLAFHR
jgi:hypothetical protein